MTPPTLREAAQKYHDSHPCHPYYCDERLALEAALASEEPKVERVEDLAHPGDENSPVLLEVVQGYLRRDFNILAERPIPVTPPPSAVSPAERESKREELADRLDLMVADVSGRNETTAHWLREAAAELRKKP